MSWIPSNNMEAKTTGKSFVIAWEDAKQKNSTLQNAFLKFKQERQVSDKCVTQLGTCDLQKEIRLQQRRKLEKHTPENLDKLRQKFLDTSLSYLGVPYARRYHGPDCEPLLLFCMRVYLFHSQLPITTLPYISTVVD